MPPLIAFLLSLFLALNSAYAAAVGVCDAFEHGGEHRLAGEHRAHVGHHSHDHAEPDAHAAADEPDGPAIPHSDHQHAHPAFAFLLAGESAPTARAEGNALGVRPVAALVSAAPSRIERPPRASFA